jgi:hypothetical protein
MPNSVRLAVVGVVFCLLLSVVTVGQQAPPSADTFVSSVTPNLNFGGNILLAVGGGTNTYLKFNLSTVPAGASVSKATLRLFVNGGVAGGQFDVYNLPSTPCGRKIH